MRPAVFLDRDGTLIDDPGYLADPAQVRLLPGVIEALRALEAAGYARIVITNQSGIGRGLFTEADYQRVRGELDRQLLAGGASITASYHCPHLPDAGCACRKPGTLLHREAAARFDLDRPGSWCVGDRPGDLLPARALGGRGVLVLSGEGARHRGGAEAEGWPVEETLLAAVRRILGGATTPPSHG